MGRRDRIAMGLGFLGGMVVGLAGWTAQIDRSRRDLFSRSAVRRMAALGSLSGRRGPRAARLLAEYVEWEPRPGLRRRGERMLQRMQADLE